ncbi:adrenocortical dysplasia protein homolog [Austrofundulus limnaeus]|uniref:Adrenocortical dysplasia protein homolog n=1 Tax=Austrofundulus limnaeus TaxID=52670 RepID=A0A2I4D2A4_AUSLI|nr:PREDICTED: adrenocortical dysplasia protein homolog [Austrofundulus limnaeus]
MARSAPPELSPWIERLILDYSGPEEERRPRSGSGCIRARVVGVGHQSMSQVRARGSDGPVELLLLSDGELRLPAVLTAAAWDCLQEQEDRESLDSFLNTNVLVQDYRLRFHMDPDLDKAMFFLSLEEVTTCGAGRFQDHCPCCTTRASIKTKVLQTWRSLLGQNSQGSQSGHELSLLLRACHQDSLQPVLDHVQVLLMTPPGLSTSPHSSSLTRSTSSWDMDRVRYKTERPFRVPVKSLLIPEGPESRTQTGPESVDHTDWQVPDLGGGPVCGPAKSSDMSDRPSSNPWDLFPPPCTSPSDESSPEPTQDQPGPVSSTPGPGSEESPSLLPPYQNPPTSSVPVWSSSVQSPAEPLVSDRTHVPAGLQTCPSLDGDHGVQEGPAVYRKPKRKRCDVTPEKVSEWEGPSPSPPSWLFQTQESRTQEDSGPKPPGPRRTPSVHEDGVPFSYTYTVSGQNLQDFSRFRVPEPVLRWALRYLLTPEPSGPPPDVR